MWPMEKMTHAVWQPQALLQHRDRDEGLASVLREGKTAQLFIQTTLAHNSVSCRTQQVL